MDDPEKMKGDYEAEEYNPPEPETDYLSPEGRIKITVERRRFPGGKDNPPYTEESYSLFFDDRLIGGSDCGETIRAAAIEALEVESSRIKKQLGRLIEKSIIAAFARNQPPQNEPADRLEE